MFALIHTYIDILLCAVDCLLLYFTLFRFTLEYALPAWNITTSDANKLKFAMWQFAALSLSHFPLIFHTIMFLHFSCCSYTLHKWQGIILMFLFCSCFPRSKYYPSMIVNTRFQIPSCNFINSTQFSAGHKISSSTRRCKFGMQWYRYRYTE